MCRLTPSSMAHPPRNVLAVVGVLWGVAFLIREAGHWISFVRAYLLSPVLGLGRANLTQYGSWAGTMTLQVQLMV